jgi:hypothetical protein
MQGCGGSRGDVDGVQLAARLILSKTKLPFPSLRVDQIVQSECGTHRRTSTGRRIVQDGAGQVRHGKMKWPHPNLRMDLMADILYYTHPCGGWCVLDLARVVVGPVKTLPPSKAS